MPGGAILRSSLREQIADALRDEILTGRLPAGGRFTVKEIADLYGVSATPVREALVDLASQGLLDVEHHWGFTVRRFTPADFESIVEARALVVEGVLRRVAEQGECPPMPDEALASVRRRGEAALRACAAGQLDVLIGCDLRYWRELTALTGNRHLHEFLDRLSVQAWMFRVPYLRLHNDLASVVWREYTVLVDALAARDTGTVRRILREYNAHLLTVVRDLAAPDTTPGTASDAAAVPRQVEGKPGTGAGAAKPGREEEDRPPGPQRRTARR